MDDKYEGLRGTVPVYNSRGGLKYLDAEVIIRDRLLDNGFHRPPPQEKLEEYNPKYDENVVGEVQVEGELDILKTEVV